MRGARPGERRPNLSIKVEERGETILATARLWSQNEKLGAAAATYAAQESCPRSCPFLDGGGCYAETGAVGSFVTRPLNVSAARAGSGPRAVALAEARAIDALRPSSGRPLRLHTVGDCSTPAAARVVSRAAGRWRERGGGPVWTYTHAWRQVPRESWGDVSVLASCEDGAGVREAWGRGYAASVTVPEFPGARRYEFDGVAVIPCPAQTRGVVCSDCRLCFDAPRLLRDRLAVGFAVHGDGFAVSAALRTLAGEAKRPSSREFVEAYIAEHGRKPPIPEVVAATGVGQSSAWQMIDRVWKRSGLAAAVARR